MLLLTLIFCSLAESSDLSAQNALDLLLNMSNARELVGNSLQVGAVTWLKFSHLIKSCQGGHVLRSSGGSAEVR